MRILLVEDDPLIARKVTAVLENSGYAVDTVRLESRDDIAILDGGHTLVLHFHTYDWTDGVNFSIHDGSRLRLNLQLNGEPIATDSIYLGRHGRHPESNPFTITR